MSRRIPLYLDENESLRQRKAKGLLDEPSGVRFHSTTLIACFTTYKVSGHIGQDTGGGGGGV